MIALLVFMFAAPIAYQVGHRVALFLSCPGVAYSPDNAADCWREDGERIFYRSGGRVR